MTAEQHFDFVAFTDRHCLEHRPPRGFPECPERLERVLDALGAAAVPIRDAGSESSVPRREHARAAAEAVHDPGYLERLRSAIEAGDPLIDTADNPLSPGSWEASWRALESTLDALAWTLETPGRRSFVAVRPPGHHAEHDRAMGFCYLNHVAIAAQHALERAGLERVAIVDIDVHHGNGTQHLFEERADVLYVSLHQWPFYPGTGDRVERGRGAGEGATLNVPLPAGTDEEGYALAFRQDVLPVLERYRPELLLVSAGFDAWRGDPLGGMRVGEDGFRQWGRWLADVAERHCAGRLISLLEGGYDLHALGPLVLAWIEGLSDPGTPERT